MVKMGIITMELVANVALYHWLNERLKKPFAAMLISILASKLFCYFLYWVVFSAAFLAEEAGTVFLAVQIAVSLIFATYAFLFNGKGGAEPVN